MSNDRLKLKEINQLPSPLLAEFFGGSVWPIYDIDVETGLMRIDVCGKYDITLFADVRNIIDGNGCKHNAEDFWL